MRTKQLKSRQTMLHPVISVALHDYVANIINRIFSFCIFISFFVLNRGITNCLKISCLLYLL